MRTVIAAYCTILLYVWLAKSFIKRAPQKDRRFLTITIILAFGIYFTLIFWVQYFYLKGGFMYGDSSSYHNAALEAINYFKTGKFFITADMVQLNYSGYSSYFLAPIYLLAGDNPLIPKLVQMLLCLHIAIRIYDLLTSALGAGRQAKMAFVFAIFFPEMIGQALYIRKDVLILWCIVNIFYYVTNIFKKGIQPKNVLYFSFLMLYLSVLRLPMAAMVFLACACYLLNRYKVPHRKLAYLTMLIASVFILRTQVLQQIDVIGQGYMQSKYAEGTLFAGATSLRDVLSTVIGNPIGSAIYAIKVLQGTFAGGLSPIRNLFSHKDDFAGPAVDWIFEGIGAIWRYLNVIVTLSGLWIILRKYKTALLHVLLFSLVLMFILFIVGFSARWGLPEMILCSICWGIGFDLISSKRTKQAAEIVSGRWSPVVSRQYQEAR
jgi:hypothetical protein